jgi:DNA primase
VETILSLRQFYIDQKIADLAKNISPEANNMDLLREIKDYNQLDQLVAQKLNRVM